MKKELVASTVRVKRISRADVERMYQLFAEYYQNHTLESFEHDLYEKNHVIILRDRENKSIQGFSTLQRVPLKKFGKKVIGVYSGDTLISKDYWGSKSLGVEFLKYLWKLKVRRPGTAVYWFLISKGYKTYMIMANNFSIHYPRYETVTPPEYKTLMNDFYSQKFGDAYHADKDLIIHPGKSCALKDHVADITPELLRDPKIAFFNDKNPGWIQGDEIACIAKMTYFMPFKYFIKKTLKGRK